MESEKRADVVIRQIQDMILKGELHEGDKLPPERELTERFDIGRPALREALKSLEILGLVERRHGLGNYIVNHVQSCYYEPLSLSFILNHGTDREIFEMRDCLETYAVRKAASFATPMDVRNLYSLEEHMESVKTPAEKAIQDRVLHFEIVRLAGNLLMYETMENLTHLMDNFIESSVTLSYFAGDSVENIYREHRAIIAAIAHNDSAAAGQAMSRFRWRKCRSKNKEYAAENLGGVILFRTVQNACDVIFPVICPRKCR
jgi:GntR family transcriptional repressor for pyruvate dehydrogenase complex